MKTNRYEKILLEADEGIAFEVSEGTSSELVIKALKIEMPDVYSLLPVVSAGEYAQELSVYIDKDGNKAVIPPGWVVSGISKENTIWGKDVSLVIYQIPWVRKVNWENPKDVEKVRKIYSQFVWCPVAMLDADGTLDNEHFSEKFGRRNYQDEEFFNDKFTETLNDELLEQIESIKKYGGFYISRYNISRSSEGKPQSVRGVKPWVLILFDDAKEQATTIEDNEMVKSHLTYGAEYDSVLAWFIKSNAKTHKEVAEDSSKWGNYSNTKNSPNELVETGSREEWCANNIYDFSGNVKEFTQEERKDAEGCGSVIRGGKYFLPGDCEPVAERSYVEDYGTVALGFRATLRIK